MYVPIPFNSGCIELLWSKKYLYHYASQPATHVVSPCRFDHYARLHDVQTLAMLACVFQKHCLEFEAKKLPCHPPHPKTPSPPRRLSHAPPSRGPPSPNPDGEGKYQDEESSHKDNCRSVARCDVCSIWH